MGEQKVLRELMSRSNFNAEKSYKTSCLLHVKRAHAYGVLSNLENCLEVVGITPEKPQKLHVLLLN